MFPQIFDDADKSELSCIIVDDIERLLGSILSNFLSICCCFFFPEKFVRLKLRCIRGYGDEA